MTGIRRIVTATSTDGREIIAADSMVAPATVALMPGAAFASLWGSDGSLSLPSDGAPPSAQAWFPPAGGFRIQEITIPPDGTPAAIADMPAAIAEMEAKLPGLAGHFDPEKPGMHRTDTVDFVYVLSGRCVLELADGARSELKAGDCVVQNGTRHAWRVPYPEPCRLLSVSMGASRKV